MGATVLIVDDDDIVRPILHMFFEDEGYQVFEAPDGRPALERLHEHPEGMVVLLDLNMPGMDGRQLLQAVAQHDDLMRRHACILLTANYPLTFPLAFARLLTELNVQVLAKPFDLDDLLTAVKQSQARLTQRDVQGAGK